MDGMAVLVQLLHADTDLVAIVPEDRIQPGILPQDTALPAISIETISKNDRNIPSPGTNRHVAERVQVTVFAKSLPEQQSTVHAVRKAAADKFPTVSGLLKVTVHTDGAGPDFMNETASIYMTTQDFRVTYSEAR